MATFDARGISIKFPFEPYPCQETYMKKVVECLQTDVNGILESPTGTGKTLCLLCSTLAWLEDKKGKVSLNQHMEMSSLLPEDGALSDKAFSNLSRGLQSSSATTWGGPEFAVPKVIYATRTHSQLSQAIQELKRTAYNNMKVSVIGSREQMCIHEQVRKEQSNTTKVHMCRNKVSARTCHYYNNMDEIKKNGDMRQAVGAVADIEDLVKFGTKNRCCPYYMARELKTDADIIFMPYNYLLDPKSRKAHGVELQGNIIIFDEAHNLEKICEDSASFDLTSTDLATAMEEVTLLAGKLVDLASNDLQSVELSTDSSIVPEFQLDDLLKVKATLQALETLLDDMEVPQAGVTNPGVYIFDLLGKVNITFESKNEILDVLEKVIAYLNADGVSSSLHTKGAGLTKFSDMLKIVFSREVQSGITLEYHQKCLAHSYRVHIHKQENVKKKKTIDLWTNAGGGGDKTGRVLSYWCFSPGHSMSDLVSHKVKCILLTSGTLSPINSFTAEMQISFPVQLENPHVIQKHQVWIGTLGKGPDGALLNSSYENRCLNDMLTAIRDKESYKSSLGNAVVNFARVVPNGLLMFFPSYPVMDKCLDFWRNTNIWNRITQYKPIFVEPREKAAFHEAMDDFYEKINDVSLNGAIFAAVCRGKVSEGLDFSDNNGRAVVITGLPFPPMMDPKVILKMKFLDEMKGKQGFQSLGGREWYRQQATRAVNQAIGRVIRHKEDFGAIILCDNRFASGQSRSQLPVWVRPHVNQYAQFGGAIRDLGMFFKTAEKVMPAARPPRPRINADTAVGAYFMSSASRRGPASSAMEKARTVTNHVPSLQQTQEDNFAMARLKIQYEGVSTPVAKKRGLLDALAFSESTRDGGDEDTGSRTPIPSYQPKSHSTKKKIIIKRPGQSSTAGCQVVETKAKVTSSSLRSAETYIQEVKDALGPESYKIFSQTLCAYKKSENFADMTATLADLFTDQPANYGLFRKFYKFVRPHHKKQFDQLCRDITGEGCGYKPEDAVSKKRLNAVTSEKDQPDKRQKLGPIVNSASHPAELPTKPLGSLNTVTAESRSYGATGANCSTNTGENVPVTGDGQLTNHNSDSPDGIVPTVEKRPPKPRMKSGYTCCLCTEDATAPFISLCDHVCCFECWRSVFLDSKVCPTCKKPVRRRHMRRLYYPSGPNLDS